VRARVLPGRHGERDEAIALSVPGSVAPERGEREAGTHLICESPALDTVRGRVSLSNRA